MFEITLEESRIVKGIFESISAVIEECTLVFDKDGISINAIDEGRICLVALNLAKNDFDSYSCEGKYELGLNIEDMVKILKRSSADDTITFKYTEGKEGSNKIKILMKGKKRKKKRTFSLQLIELGKDELNVQALDQIDFKAKVTLPLAYLEEAIKDADIYSETVIVSFSEDGNIVFKSEGAIGEIECTLEKDDDGIENFSAEGVSEGIFSLEYLKNIVKISIIADKVELALSPTTPLKAKFNLLAESTFKYFLAPRIEEEEDNDYDDDY